MDAWLNCIADWPLRRSIIKPQQDERQQGSLQDQHDS